jgi:hypothetical protein
MTDTFDPFDTPDIKEPLNDEWAAKRRIADATRRLIEHLVTTTADKQLLDSVADKLNEQADELSKGTKLYGRMSFEAFENGRHGTEDTLGYELNPLDGKSNPIAPPFNIWFEDGIAYGRANLGWQYEGPPKSVHGGFVCALFDQFLGVSQKMTGQPGVTGTLTTRFIRPTPLCTDLKLIGKVREVKGRKNFLSGEIWAGDTLTASCEGLFIHISPERFRSLLGE